MFPNKRLILHATAWWLLCVLAPATARGDDGSLLRDLERHEHPGPPGFVFERPDEEWRFVDLDRQRAALGGSWSARRIEDSFRDLVARLFHQGLRITISVYVRAETDPARVARGPGAVLDELVQRLGRRPGLRLREAKLISLGGRPAAWVRCDTPGGDDGDEPWLSIQIECPVAASGHRLVLFLEAPRQNSKAARSALARLVRSFRWR